MVVEYPCSVRDRDRVSFFESFHRSASGEGDKGIRFLNEVSCHAGNCTVQVKTTRRILVLIYASRENQAEEARALLEGMSDVELFCEGWGLE